MHRFKELPQEEQEKIIEFGRKYNETTISFYTELFKEFQKDAVGQPYYRAYLNIVKNTARLMRELGSKDAVSASIIFEYLLWNGYLSKDRQLIYCESGRINNLAVSGADIMRGKSVCLNNAEMLTRVLDEMGLDATLIGCRVVPPKNAKREYTPPIKREVIKEKHGLLHRMIGYPITKAIGNHAVTLCGVGNAYCISDPTSLAFASITDFQKATYIGMAGLDMELKPQLMFALNEGNKKECVETMIKTALLTDRQPLNLEKVKFLYEGIVEGVDRQKHLLDDFHDSNREDIDVVCKTLKSKKF